MTTEFIKIHFIVLVGIQVLHHLINQLGILLAREKFRELSLQEHLQLPLAELEPVSFPAGVAVKGSNHDVHGNLQLGGHAGSRGEHSRVSRQSRGENACEG